MRTFFGISIFLIVGLAAALWVGFRPDWPGTLPWDDEQTGLNERIVMKFSHVVAENTPKGLAAEHFARLVKERSNDKVEIQVFPNAQLYSEKDEAEALQRGDIHLIAPTFSNMSKIDSAWLVMDLPYVFADQAAVDAALQGKIGQRLFQRLEQNDMEGLAFWNNGFKQMTSNRGPLLTPEDFQGQTFRIMPSAVLEAQFRHMGATTITAPFNEVYQLLHDGKADGQENTISNIFSKRVYQVQNYLTLSDHGYLGYSVVANRSFWLALPEDIRYILTEALKETGEWMSAEMERVHKEQLAQLEAMGGIQIHRLTEKEKEAWRASLQGVYDQFRSDIGAEMADEVERIQQRRDVGTVPK